MENQENQYEIKFTYVDGEQMTYPLRYADCYIAMKAYQTKLRSLYKHNTEVKSIELLATNADAAIAYHNFVDCCTKIHLAFAGLLIAIGLLLPGCSYKTEIGWHGWTGRDDRTVTSEFITPADQERIKKVNQRY